MKKSLVLGTILLIVMVLSVTSIAGAKSAATPSKGLFTNSATMDVKFDGFCDGVTFTLNPTNGVASGKWMSACWTCDPGEPFNDNGAGTLSVIRNQGLGLTVAWQTIDQTPTFLWTVIRADHTWAHYHFDGTEANYGTWTECLVGAQSTGKTPSISK